MLYRSVQYTPDLRCSQDSRRLSFSTLRHICNTTHAWNKGRQEGVSKVTL